MRTRAQAVPHVYVKYGSYRRLEEGAVGEFYYQPFLLIRSQSKSASRATLFDYLVRSRLKSAG